MQMVAEWQAAGSRESFGRQGSDTGDQLDRCAQAYRRRLLRHGDDETTKELLDICLGIRF
jgi:hypothetical protein